MNIMQNINEVDGAVISIRKFVIRIPLVKKQTRIRGIFKKLTAYSNLTQGKKMVKSAYCLLSSPIFPLAVAILLAQIGKPHCLVLV